jgi:hypothetical protein
LTERIIGVRCVGEKHLVFAYFEGEFISHGEPVRIRDGDRVISGTVVIAPDQMLEFHAPEPSARAELDEALEKMPCGEAASLLKSLNLPGDLLRP